MYSIFYSYLGYNNCLQHRFDTHPRLWCFIHFLKGEEALVMMRTAQIQSGNYCLKAMPFSFGNERARKKTKQLKKLWHLFEIAGKITLNKYIKNLSCFVGESTIAKKKKQQEIQNSVIIGGDNCVEYKDGNSFILLSLGIFMYLFIFNRFFSSCSMVNYIKKYYM